MNIQTEIQKMLNESGWTQKMLAHAAGINESALSKFMSRNMGKSIPERVFPFVFGDKRPSHRNDGNVHEDITPDDPVN